MNNEYGNRGGDRGGRSDRGGYQNSRGGYGNRGGGHRSGDSSYRKDGSRQRSGKSYGSKGGYRDGSSRSDRGGYGDRKPYGERQGGGYGNRQGGYRGGKPYGDRDDRGQGRSYGNRGGGYRGNDRGGSRSFDHGPRPDRERSFDGERRFDRGLRDFREERRFDGPPREKLHVDRGHGDRAFEKSMPREPLHGDSDLLKRTLDRIAGKGFGAYRDVAGTFAFDGYELSINRVQRDPFAPPSKLTVRVSQDIAGFDENLYDEPWRRRALEDHVLRAFGKALGKNAFDFADFIKGGAFSVSRPGPEVLTRSACSIDADAVEIRFEATFPARERAIATREFEEMFFATLPRIVNASMLAVSYEEGELEAVANLADDQHFIREELAKRGLVAFVADGAILPRESGVSQRPMVDAKPFASPETLRVEMAAPHAGTITGMGIPKGITLIIGGGYHGKSTLLKAVEAGVYDHVAGDGREYVICDATAMKLRAEDGRSVRGTDISLFINNLPNGIPTDGFWTDDASGSTSQAASTAEALEAKSRVFLIDEDTSATNFMVREPLMQAVIARGGEPITPFVERLRDLYAKAGVSTVIVAGSSGAFFQVADTVIQMEDYEPADVIDKVRAVCKEQNAPAVADAPGFKLPNADRLLTTPQHPLVVKTASDARKADAERREGKGHKGPERLRAKVLSGVDIRVGSVGSDMRFVEQLVDHEQTKTLACIVKACLERDLLTRMSVADIVAEIWSEIQEGGLQAVADTKVPECGLAMPRREEVFACLNRLRPRD